MYKKYEVLFDIINYLYKKNTTKNERRDYRNSLSARQDFVLFLAMQL